MTAGVWWLTRMTEVLAQRKREGKETSLYGEDVPGTGVEKGEVFDDDGEILRSFTIGIKHLSQKFRMMNDRISPWTLSLAVLGLVHLLTSERSLWKSTDTPFEQQNT